ncbi:tetratricopeptide repeat protein [Bacillus wiedmannii]|uniref:response regulator aspartate phosphatase n=1 Tax=Bacillus wiedmannii TaxID=1890302 RepID=UPI000CD83030|nr:tetratricopeptide repeat protein [Bacillus wiedmannii]MBG9832031.1 hypothetical protein [Bacillus wiedmannii]UOB98641.1 response regulator aspartate phosphatase F [Bacillus wiedmannii]
MNVQLKGNEQLNELLNEWYLAIRSRNLNKAVQFNENIKPRARDFHYSNDLSLYYALIQFRYNVFINRFGVTEASFKDIDSFPTPDNGIMSYYYHLFKSMYYTAIGNYNKAEEHLIITESKLIYCTDKLDIAEFHYTFGSMLHRDFQLISSIQHIQKAQETFLGFEHCELNIAFCNNILGLSWAHLKKYEQAEKYYKRALNTFYDLKEDGHILMVKHNLGLMYSEQNKPSLAIQCLAEVNQKISNNFRALFIEARELSKLKRHQDASERIERGLNICIDLKNKEYPLHFEILKGINDNIPALALEPLIQKALNYFTSNNLLNYTLEYKELLAHKYLDELNHLKACEFFQAASKTRNEIQKKGGLI